jgi:LmbE family N-acetylglucosaminyl deacetylase
MRKTFFALLSFFILSDLTLFAQVPEPFSAPEIYLRLKKLNVLGSALYVAAHPDDENSRLIAYLSKDRLYRTGYLSMTRGDGGQNLIGDEQGVELGLIRTQEMLAARQVDGAEQFFTRAFDFGYTKTTEEALKVWNKEKILSDVVWVIRKFQPDIMIARFSEDVGRSGGHGQHSAASRLAHEAIAAAADPGRFPEQLKLGVTTWQVKRLYWNTFRFGSFNTTSEDQLKLDVGTFNAALGEGYGEIAAESRVHHKSQGAALIKTRGEGIEYFETIVGEKPSSDIMEGVNTTWSRVPGTEKIQQLVQDLIHSYSMTEPEKLIPGLLALHKALLQLPEGYWKKQKLDEVRQLIERCSGLWLETVVDHPYLVRGDSIKIGITMTNRLRNNITVESIRINGVDSSLKQNLAYNKNYTRNWTAFISRDQPITQPYWLVSPMSPGSFNVADQKLIGLPQGDPPLQAEFSLTVEGEPFRLTRPILYKKYERLVGDIYQPVTIVPRLTGQFDPNLVVFTDGETKTFDINTRTFAKLNYRPRLVLTDSANLGIKQESNFHDIRYSYQTRPAKGASELQYSSLLNDKDGTMDSVMELETISYEHIPRIDYFLPAKAKFVITDVKIAGKRIGYIEGAGDKVPQALEQMGFDVVLLKEKDITPANLRQFDALITGIRAYNVHPGLADKYDALMDYVQEGGNLIMQYNQLDQDMAKVKIGPYPLHLSSARVTDENAKVNFLQPSDPVLNFPNKITDKDFDGWVQERGIYFPDRMDTAYRAVFSMHDPGESDQKGSLVIADYGKGKFVYTGLVFFRQLPAGVPGAYRLLANIIALNYKRGF